MKRFLFLAAVVLIAMSITVPAFAWSQIYGARVTGDHDATIDLNSWFTTTPATGALQNSGATSTAAGIATDATNKSWGAILSSNTPAIGLRSATYAIALPTIAGVSDTSGYYNVYTTFAGDTNAKSNAKHVITSAGGATDTKYVNQTLAAALKNTWVSLGTYMFNQGDAANTKVTLTNDNQTNTGSLYIHSIKFESATAGAITNTGIANNAVDVATMGGFLSWNAGAFTQNFDVYFGTSSTAMAQIGFGTGSTSVDLTDMFGPLAEGTQYFWRVDSRNLDNLTTGSVYSFTTVPPAPVPEPGSLLALGTGLVGLLGLIRRKSA